jgi:hypothetical protein
MNRLTGSCGIDCGHCPALKATLANDDALRASTAAEWSKTYGADIPPAAVNCVGCCAEGVHIGHWDECGIRRCAGERALANCAGCADYSCARLDEFLRAVPDARAALEEIRKARPAK